MSSKRLPLIAILLAAFLTTGAQWDCLQIAGWARMFANCANAGASLPQAFEAIFAGELCEICEAVDEARQEKENHEATVAPKAGKVLLAVYAAAEIKVSDVSAAVVGAAQWSLSDPVCHSAGRASPPLPPPKA